MIQEINNIIKVLPIKKMWDLIRETYSKVKDTALNYDLLMKTWLVK